MPERGAKRESGSEPQKAENDVPMSAANGARLHRPDGRCRGMRVARSKDLCQAQEILDTDHYGLERVSTASSLSISRFKAVNKNQGADPVSGGAAGVGKTSLGQSIAKATGRKYIRMALGGVRDESEIRGHRRTYIGLCRVKPTARVKTTVPALDETDKMSSDMRGDPGSHCWKC